MLDLSVKKAHYKFCDDDHDVETYWTTACATRQIDGM